MVLTEVTGPGPAGIGAREKTKLPRGVYKLTRGRAHLHACRESYVSGHSDPGAGAEGKAWVFSFSLKLSCLHEIIFMGGLCN